MALKTVDGKTDLFGNQAQLYASFRPRYPAFFVEDILAYAQGSDLLVDVATGSGQVAVPFSEHFSRIIGIDTSESQLQHAQQKDNIEYKLGLAYPLSLESGVADVITVGQALHWFDIPAYFAEVKRVLKPEGVAAILGYGTVSLPDNDPAQAAFSAFYQSLGSYWDCDRSLIDAAFSTVHLPFLRDADASKEEVEAVGSDTPRVTAEEARAGAFRRIVYRQRTPLSWEGFSKYLQTWSAYQKFLRENPGAEDPVDALMTQLRALYPSSAQEITVQVPFFLIIGRVA
eukprot:GILI01037515.1.p1 GENE.GILI01037515.1~~GILI01037515.1.p1  ORF type:complete len:302 (-),score=53.50 GILI01037515.1:222-1079(-)